MEEVTATVRRTLELHSEVLIATDGSSKEDIGGFGVVVHTPMQVHSSGDGSEDQDPFRQELLGPTCASLKRMALKSAAFGPPLMGVT